MARIIFNDNTTVDAINEKRKEADFNMSYEQRIYKAFKLMKLALLFSQKDKSTFKKKLIIKL